MTYFILYSSPPPRRTQPFCIDAVRVSGQEPGHVRKQCTGTGQTAVLGAKAFLWYCQSSALGLYFGDYK